MAYISSKGISVSSRTFKNLKRFTKKPFDLYEIYDYVRPRRTMTEEGDQISEWQVPLDDLKVFLERLKKQ